MPKDTKELDQMIDALFGAVETMAEATAADPREVLGVVSSAAIRWAQAHDISPADYAMLQAAVIAGTTGIGEVGKTDLMKALTGFNKRKPIR
jgi:hypothetical protein